MDETKLENLVCFVLFLSICHTQYSYGKIETTTTETHDKWLVTSVTCSLVWN